MRGFALQGDAVGRARKAHGLTQESLAQLVGCDIKTIRNAEKGRRVDASTARQIAESLELPLASIVSVVDDPIHTAQQNIDIFWQWQTASNDRDVDGMLRLYYPDATVAIPGANDLPGGGMYRGLEAIRGQIEAAFEAFQTEKLTTKQLKVDGIAQFVFVRGEATAIVRATGRQFSAFAIHEMEFRDGKIFHHKIAVDSAGVRRSVRGT